MRVLYDYVTGVLSQFRNDDRVLGWDLWNEPDNPARVYREVERNDKQERVADLLPRVFRRARSVDPAQPLTSAVWDGDRADPGRHSVISGIQLDNADVITFHCYDEPAAFESRITSFPHQGARSCAPSTWPGLWATLLRGSCQSPSGTTLVHSIGVWSPANETYFPWDSWDHPYTTAPKVWFHDLLQPDGRPYKCTQMDAIEGLTGPSGPRVQSC